VGPVREDYSEDGNAWKYVSHDQARSRAYKWGEDGLGGICDDRQRLCFALALWNERDPILKERLFDLTKGEGNHGEDVKELYFYVDGTPTHSYMKHLHKYPQAAFPYRDLIETKRVRSREEFEYELLDTGVFNARAGAIRGWHGERPLAAGECRLRKIDGPRRVDWRHIAVRPQPVDHGKTGCIHPQEWTQLRLAPSLSRAASPPPIRRGYSLDQGGPGAQGRRGQIRQQSRTFTALGDAARPPYLTPRLYWAKARARSRCRTSRKPCSTASSPRRISWHGKGHRRRPMRIARCSPTSRSTLPMLRRRVGSSDLVACA
jgi:hypothetical protein